MFPIVVLIAWARLGLGLGCSINYVSKNMIFFILKKGRVGVGLSLPEPAIPISKQTLPVPTYPTPTDR